jgi:hypothetical protein
MQRLRDYLRFVAFNAGAGYIALWAMTFWTLDHGPAVFGGSGLCHPDDAKILFYWVCDASTPLGILAGVANTALTVTVWAPVYVAAATVRPDAIAIAVPIVLAHAIGLPTAIFVAIRAMLALLQLPRRLFGRRQAAAAPAAADDIVAARIVREIARRPRIATTRSHFGLRGTAQG